MEHHQPDIYGELFLAGNPGLPGQVAQSNGIGAQATWASPSLTNGILLPEPRVSFESGPAVLVAAPGGTLNTSRYIHFKAHELPAILRTDPTLRAQVELMRHRSTKSLKRGVSPQRRQSSGWVHPTNVLGNISGPHEGGMRAGLHSPVNTTSGLIPIPDRKTEWLLAGATPYGAFAIVDIAEIFGKFFRVSKVVDGNGGVISAWTYLNGRTYTNGTRTGTQRRVGQVTNVGKFAFRYSYLDPATGRRITGPMTPPIMVCIRRPLFRKDPVGQPWNQIVSPGADVSVFDGNRLDVRWHSVTHI